MYILGILFSIFPVFSAPAVTFVKVIMSQDWAWLTVACGMGQMFLQRRTNWISHILEKSKKKHHWDFTCTWKMIFIFYRNNILIRSFGTGNCQKMVHENETLWRPFQSTSDLHWQQLKSVPVTTFLFKKINSSDYLQAIFSLTLLICNLLKIKRQH